MLRLRSTLAALAALVLPLGVGLSHQPAEDLLPAEIAAIDASLAAEANADALVQTGPYVSNPAVLAELDRSAEGVDCDRLGRLVFGCLIQGRVKRGQRPSGREGNPFNLHVASLITSTITTDLGKFKSFGGHIDPKFLTDAASRLELVGIVNRMDRKFVPDPRSDVGRREDCGEISLIYRFRYSIGDNASSRLPVTMNVVLPARPNDAPPSAHPCQDVARRWMAELARPRDRDPKRYLADLLNPRTGVLAHVHGRDIDRIELNIQVFRRETSEASNQGLGSTAAYVIRVFRWDNAHNQFVASYLMNQIDRQRLLGLPDDDNSCATPRPSGDLRASFLEWLSTPAAVRDADNGTLVIPFQYLACRAVSHSPGGPVRSGNSPFWADATGGQTVVTDAELARIIAGADRPPTMFRTADDLRMRLNELTCTGCHQTRAIAGFHFPGEDRATTFPANAVHLPGSPHFYGDQPRRVEFIRLLASGRKAKPEDYLSGYASRPLNRYRAALASTQLIGGWGAACLMPSVPAQSQRLWSCRPELTCEQQFVSTNAPGLGTCVPKGSPQVGDPMQVGVVASPSFGDDRYERTLPRPVRNARDVLIDPPAGMSVPPPNSYYVAHQEFYDGDIRASGQTGPQRALTVRDAKTGGFPAGMLRLSECTGLHGEATCGLVATTGFNDCIKEVEHGRSLIECFTHRTSYSGLRACSASSPCRDDYICLRSMGYDANNAERLHKARADAVAHQDGYDPEVDFGQRMPGRAWLARNGGRGDGRGVCIPPYFVFQFRSDGHPHLPASSTQPSTATITRRN